MRMLNRGPTFLLMLCTAEGNPDEEKIGAFGVGQSTICSVSFAVAYCVS